MTALDALSSALRPSQAAEDVLSRLLAMGWDVRRREFVPNATTLAAIDEIMRDLAWPAWLVWVRRLLGRG